MEEDIEEGSLILDDFLDTLDVLDSWNPEEDELELSENDQKWEPWEGRDEKKYREGDDRKYYRGRRKYEESDRRYKERESGTRKVHREKSLEKRTRSAFIERTLPPKSNRTVLRESGSSRTRSGHDDIKDSRGKESVRYKNEDKDRYKDDRDRQPGDERNRHSDENRSKHTYEDRNRHRNEDRSHHRDNDADRKRSRTSRNDIPANEKPDLRIELNKRAEKPIVHRKLPSEDLVPPGTEDEYMWPSNNKLDPSPPPPPGTEEDTKRIKEELRKVKEEAEATKKENENMGEGLQYEEYQRQWNAEHNVERNVTDKSRDRTKSKWDESPAEEKIRLKNEKFNEKIRREREEKIYRLREQEVKPERRVRSALSRSRSPLVLHSLQNRSPRKRSRSPRKRSRSPRKRSRSPRKHSRTRVSTRYRSLSPRHSRTQRTSGGRSRSRSRNRSLRRETSPRIRAHMDLPWEERDHSRNLDVSYDPTYSSRNEGITGSQAQYDAVPNSVYSPVSSPVRSCDPLLEHSESRSRQEYNSYSQSPVSKRPMTEDMYAARHYNNYSNVDNSVNEMYDSGFDFPMSDIYKVDGHKRGDENMNQSVIPPPPPVISKSKLYADSKRTNSDPHQADFNAYSSGHGHGSPELPPVSSRGSACRSPLLRGVGDVKLPYTTLSRHQHGRMGGVGPQEVTTCLRCSEMRSKSFVSVSSQTSLCGTSEAETQTESNNTSKSGSSSISSNKRNQPSKNQLKMPKKYYQPKSLPSTPKDSFHSNRDQSDLSKSPITPSTTSSFVAREKPNYSSLRVWLPTDPQNQHSEESSKPAFSTGQGHKTIGQQISSPMLPQQPSPMMAAAALLHPTLLSPMMGPKPSLSFLQQQAARSAILRSTGPVPSPTPMAHTGGRKGHPSTSTSTSASVSISTTSVSGNSRYASGYARKGSTRFSR